MPGKAQELLPLFNGDMLGIDGPADDAKIIVGEDGQIVAVASFDFW